MVSLFWISISIIVYVYIGYPLLVFLFGKLLPKPIEKREYLPFVSILIAAYNEADVIEDTVRNKLELDYPADKYEVLVISDGSDDGTDEIVDKLD